MKKTMHLIAALGLAIGISGTAHAQLVTNGDFESTNQPAGFSGQVGYNINVTGWSVPDPTQGLSYTFLMAPGAGDTTGASTIDGNLKIWGPGDNSINTTAGNGLSSNNGLPATSPTGGNYIVQDAGYRVGAISQTLTGLTVGQTYNVSFWWASAQLARADFTGPTTSRWDVSLGGSTQDTAYNNIAGEGFSGWEQVTMTFTADATSDLLSFKGDGNPSGEPPMVLLDGVSVTSTTPEGSSLGLLSMGLLSIGGLSAYVRRAKATKSVKSAS